MTASERVKEYGIITAGTCVIAAAVFFFLAPCNLAVGSASGLAIVLSHFIPIDLSYITLALNVTFLILGFALIGNEFGVKTVFTSVLLPVFLWIFERIFPDFQSLTDDAFLDMLCYCFVVSIGLALLFIRNASSGGLDIAAKILNKFFRMELGKAMSAAGIAVALLSALCYDKKTVVISLIGTYLNGIILDRFLFELNEKLKVCVISRKFEDIRRFIIDELHSGATVYDARGAYGEMKPHPELQVIVDKTEYTALMRYLQKTDPHAFVTVYKVREMAYISKKK